MSRLWQKLGASTVNCVLVLLLTLPLLLVLNVEQWKIVSIAIFWSYNICFRSRCLGMRLVGTFIEGRSSILYVSLYTAGFSTFFYCACIPGDLLAANTIAQIVSLAMTNNTLHANLAGQGTITAEEYVARAQRRAGMFWLDGKYEAAVISLATDLSRWPDLRVPDWIVDGGMRMAVDKDAHGVRLWIDGIRGG